MVFAAGLGTRLKPFTDNHPKALAEVCGRPMLSIVIERLKSVGVTEIVVNVHHFADQIIDYLRANDNFGITVYISNETDKLLDTGGGILAAGKWLEGNEPVIVHNADILTDVNISAMLDVACDTNAVSTLLVAPRKTKRYLLFNPIDMRMKGWTNIESNVFRPDNIKSLDGLLPLAFGGIHVISPAIFPYLEKYAKKITSDRSKAVFSITDFYIDSCSDLKICGYQPVTPYRWHDIGRPESLESAENDFYSELSL